MSHREVLIMLAHARWCSACRDKLVTDPAPFFVGRALSEDEKNRLAELTADDFGLPARLVQAAGVTIDELDQYADHPVVRLRHF